MSHKQNDHQISVQSTMYQAFFNSAGDAIDILNTEGIVLDVNPAFEELYGWTKQEIVGKTLPIIPQHRLAEVKKLIESASNGIGVRKFEAECIHKNGQPLIVNLTFSPIYDETGKVIGVTGISRDITEKKVTERLLRESEERYQKLVDMSPEPVAVIREGRIRYINKAGIQVFGFDRLEDMLNQSIFGFLPLNNRTEVVKKMVSLLKEKEYTVDFVNQEMIRPDGSTIIVESTAMGIIYENKPSIQVVFHDVTERRKMEKALVLSEEKYRLIADNMTDVVSILDVDGVMTYASPSHEFVLGYTPEMYEGQVVFDMIHPEDLPTILPKFKEIVSTGTSQTVEFRHKHFTKGWLWLEVKGSLFYDEKQQRPYVLIVGRDNEERRNLQEQLKALAFQDELTSLPNRRLFEETVKKTLGEAKLHDKHFAILYLDMDDFKRINDELGHAMGDVVLQQFANRVKASIREQDLLARIGGDEFAILLNNLQSRESIQNYINLVSSNIAEKLIVQNQYIETSSSIGVAYYPEDGQTYSDLLQHADLEMYKQKHSM